MSPKRRFASAGPADPEMELLGPSHVAHVSGYEVYFSRYSLTYQDARRRIDLGAEIDAEGVLNVHAGDAGEEALGRIGAALDFLNVAYAIV